MSKGTPKKLEIGSQEVVKHWMDCRLRIGSGPAACVASPPWMRAGWSFRVSSWLWKFDFWHFCHIDFMTKFPKVFLGLGSMILDVYQVWNPMGNSESPLRQETCISAFPSSAHEMSAIKPSMVVSFRRQTVSTGCPLYPITERMSGCPRQCLSRSLEKRQNKSISSIFEDLADQRWAKDFSSFNKQSPRALTSIGVRMASWHSVALAP